MISLLRHLFPARAAPLERLALPALNRHVTELYRAANYDGALGPAEFAVGAIQREHWLEDADVAGAFTNLGLLYLAKSDYGQAGPLLMRALAILERVFGPEHPETAVVINNCALFYKATGEYGRAEPLYGRALKILEKSVGTCWETAQAYKNLAVLYEAESDYRRAEPLYKRALEMIEATLGTNHRETAHALVSLAAIYKAEGDWGRAEFLYQRALTICRDTFGPNSIYVAHALTHLAGLYQATRDYRRAEPLYEEALDLYSRFPGPGVPAAAAMFNNIAAICQARGDYAGAASLFQRALAVFESLFGAEHPQTAVPLHNLALLHIAQGDWPSAGPVCERVLTIDEKNLGPCHPQTARALNDLGWVQLSKENYTGAEALFNRCLGIREQVLGTEHPETGMALQNLGVLHWSKVELSAAALWLLRSAKIRERNVELILSAGSEMQKQAYLSVSDDCAALSVCFHTRAAPDLPDALRLAMLAVLQRKGRVLEAVAAENNALRQRLNPENRELLDELMELRTLRSNMILRGPGERNAAEHREEILKLEARENELGATISSRSAEFAAQSQPVTLERIQAAVPPATALVELVQYQPFDPRRILLEHKSAEPQRYAAYMLFHEGDPVWKDLGDAEPIDRVVGQFRLSLSSPDADNTRQLARQIDELVMAPVRKLLGETRQVFLSPDGQLNLVPFAAFIDEDGRYLLERYTFTYLGSGRDLLRFQVPVASRQGPLLMADPDYEGTAAPKTPTLAKENRRSAQFGMRFGPLAGTAEEAKTLKQLLSLPDDSVLTGLRATESAIKSVAGPQLLHIATHGFFLEDQAAPTISARTFVNPTLVDAMAVPGFPGGENPLLRSGLALAGANRLESGAEDGILTALEASALDLWGTQLVVLSACETGVGDVRTGEGVYGLRRALALAGSRTQVMSLWKVSDPATKELMVAYYSRLLKNEGRSEALRAVQNDMLAGYRWTHPYYWAAFILSGEGGPLSMA